MNLKTLSVILMIPILAACAGKERIVVEGITYNVPESLQTCAPKPKKPSGGYTQRDVAKYISRLSAAHSDCAEDLAAVNSLVNNANKIKNKKKKK